MWLSLSGEKRETGTQKGVPRAFWTHTRTRVKLPRGSPLAIFQGTTLTTFFSRLFRGVGFGALVIILASHHWDSASILGSYVGCDWLISI